MIRRSIKYINGSYVGFLQEIRATSNMDSIKEVKDQLDFLETILKKYDPQILKKFFSINKKTIENFLLNPDDLIFAFDIKQNPSLMRKTFDDVYKQTNENISFKEYYKF